jgi:hypothetical protein
MMRDDSQLMKAMIWLQETLADKPLPAVKVKSVAAKAGFSPMTVRRAREHLGIVVVREGFGPGGRWLWRAPSANDVQTGHLTCSENNAFDDGLAALLSLDLEPALDAETWAALDAELQNLHLDAEDYALMDLPPPPERRRR